jgi:cytochrome b561
MGSFSKNTQNGHPTKGVTLQTQAEISKKRTNFGVLVTAIAAARMCINRKSPARKTTERSSIEHSHAAKAELNTGGRITLSDAT